jgi:hypothetical protein
MVEHSVWYLGSQVGFIAASALYSTCNIFEGIASSAPMNLIH